MSIVFFILEVPLKDFRREAQTAAMEPIAIIGLDLKFPGEATDAEGFWRMLVEGQSALKDIPDDRFKVSSFHHPDPERAGSVSLGHIN